MRRYSPDTESICEQYSQIVVNYREILYNPVLSSHRPLLFFYCCSPYYQHIDVSSYISVAIQYCLCCELSANISLLFSYHTFRFQHCSIASFFTCLFGSIYCNCVFSSRQTFLILSAGIAQSVQRRATGWTAGLRFSAATRYFLYSVRSRQALEPTQPTTQWVPGANFPG
jgi:hypothetical protein